MLTIVRPRKPLSWGTWKNDSGAFVDLGVESMNESGYPKFIHDVSSVYFRADGTFTVKYGLRGEKRTERVSRINFVVVDGEAANIGYRVQIPVSEAQKVANDLTESLHTFRNRTV